MVLLAAVSKCARRRLAIQVLVTGANGFVGRQLCALLLAKGYRVRRSVRRLESEPTDAPFVSGDVDGHTDWRPALVGVDAVVHLISRVHIMQDHSANPLADYRLNNVEVTRNLAEQAAAAGVKHFIYMSSTKAVGERNLCDENGAIIRFREDMLAKPDSPYGQSKWEAEQILRQIAPRTSMSVTILRPPLVYGPGVRENFLAMLKIVNRGLPLPLALVRNQRSLIYVNNLADACELCLRNPRAYNQTFFVSDGLPLSTAELVRKMAAALGKKPRLLPVPITWVNAGAAMFGKRDLASRLTDSLAVDSSKIENLLGWRPPFNIERGLAACVDDVRRLH